MNVSQFVYTATLKLKYTFSILSYEIESHLKLLRKRVKYYAYNFIIQALRDKLWIMHFEEKYPIFYNLNLVIITILY